MYRYQGTNRSNGIYYEPDNSHHQISSPHVSKKSSNSGGTSSKSRNNHHQQHRTSRSNNRSQHVPLQQHRNDGMESGPDSSSEGSDGSYSDSDNRAPGMTMANRLNISQSGKSSFFYIH